MIQGYIERKVHHFQEWWHAPVTRRDRVRGAVIGGAGCFWVGLLGRVILGPTPVSFAVVGAWALGGVFAGAILGVFFPKVTSTICFPFSTFGMTGGT